MSVLFNDIVYFIILSICFCFVYPDALVKCHTNENLEMGELYNYIDLILKKKVFSFVNAHVSRSLSREVLNIHFIYTLSK